MDSIDSRQRAALGNLAPPEPSPKRGSFLPVMMASVLGVVVFAALFFITMQIAMVVLVAAVLIFVVSALHYFTWGWWLSASIHEDVANEDAQQE